jgi:CubicO group peptidase (beta-lactamase class C family)
MGLTHREAILGLSATRPSFTRAQHMHLACDMTLAKPPNVLGRQDRFQTGFHIMSDRPEGLPEVQGHVTRGFEAVRKAFVENFARRRELGGACCAYHRGEKVVDLWGGVRNKLTGELWEQDTMVLVYSATKGLAAMTLALAHSRGWLDYEERVAAYWPEFAQQGKEKITVRQLLAHQAGLFAFDEPVDRSIVGDLDRLADVLARQKPAWEPGTRQAYHAITLGVL